MDGASFSNDGDVPLNQGSSDAWIATLSLPLLTEKNAGRQALLFSPNPTTGFTTIHLAQAGAVKRVRIIDSQGQIVQDNSYKSHGFQIAIDLGNLTPGIYLAEVVLEDGSKATERVVRCE